MVFINIIIIVVIFSTAVFSKYKVYVPSEKKNKSSWLEQFQTTRTH